MGLEHGGACSSAANWIRLVGYIPGANGNKPFGPGGPDASPHEPMVHLAWDDRDA
jgi:hypothetical protein